MKQKYFAPECEITAFTSEDIITVSGADAAQDSFAEFGEDYFS